MALRSAFLLIVAVFGGGTMGCEREAAKPVQCLTSALLAHGASLEQYHASKALAASVQNWTVRCLTQPYSPALLACLDSNGASPACQLMEAWEQ